MQFKEKKNTQCLGQLMEVYMHTQVKGRAHVWVYVYLGVLLYKRNHISYIFKIMNLLSGSILCSSEVLVSKGTENPNFHI